jgi:hypothetical protein
VRFVQGTSFFQVTPARWALLKAVCLCFSPQNQMDSYEDGEGLPSDTEAACRFVRRLPASLLSADKHEVAWLCGVFQQGECLADISMLEATEAAARLVPPGKAAAPLCTPSQLGKRLWQAMAIAYELDKTGEIPCDWDTSDAELPKWVEAVRKARLGDPSSAHRWQIEKLVLDDRWQGLWRDAGQLLDYSCKRRLTDWLPQFQDLPKAPVFNVPGRQPPPMDKVLKNIDDHLREVARGLRCLHLSLLQDGSLTRSVTDAAAMTGMPLTVPAISVQIENLFAMIGCTSVYVDNNRLRSVDSRLEFEVHQEEGLVGKAELARLETAQRLQSKMPGNQKSGKGAGKGFQNKSHPYSFRPHGNGKGKGKGRGKGKGKGKGFMFPKPTAPDA